MPYTHLTERDYDQQLRDMGNYLWDLEQAADVASAQELSEDVQSIEAKIRGLGKRAADFAGVEGSHRFLAMYVAGLAQRMVREWAMAAGWFEQVVEAQPGNGDAWLELTWCLAELQDWRRCIAAARQTTRLYPQAGAAWGNLALALQSAGDLPGAATALRRALALDPQDARNRALAAQLQVSG
ncbi:MAG TPA: tetratricopeptide repeat protein [Chthoniobacterales bacterium]